MLDSIRHSIAKNVRALLEPNGAHGNTPSIVFHELKVLLEKQNPDMKISSYSELVDILNFHYNSQTVERLLSKLTPAIVWDCSICNISHENLKQLFYKKDIVNIVTSAFFKELLNLAYTQSNSYSEESQNAKFLVDAILQDKDSRFCKAVSLTPSNTYVDTQLLKFCVTNGYKLYTQDYLLSLRARAENVDVTIFHSLENVTFPEVVSNSEGKNLILLEDLISRSAISIDVVLSYFENVNANKLIITSQFLSTLEELKDSQDVNIRKNVRRYVHFLVLHPEIVIYSKQTIVEICNEYNAIAMSSSLKKCFDYKCLGIEYELFYSSVPTSSSKIQKHTDTAVTTVIPGYSQKHHAIALKKLPISEKIWIHDSLEKVVSYSARATTVPIKPGYTIVHGVNNLNGTCSLTAYKVKPNFLGKVVYEITFQQNKYEDVSSPYKTYVTMLALST